MKTLRHIGSLAFVVGLFVVVFAGMPWHVIVADDPVVPWWLRIVFRGLFVSRSNLILENLALRQQLTVQQRTIKRSKLKNTDSWSIR